MIILKLIDKIFNFILISFFIIAISFSAYALYDINMIQNDIKLEGNILKYKPKKLEEQTTTFNLIELQTNINKDICGWIKLDGTNIDYPIMYPKTPLEYLSKSYDGTYSVSGSIFLDIKNDRSFNDDYTVIYGHNVSDKLMFADIKKFKDKDFFNEYKGGKLYIQDEIYDIEIISFNILDSNKDIAYKVDKYKKGRNNELINNFSKTIINKNEIEINNSDKFILLSTCNGVGSSERAVLFCRIKKSTTTDNIVGTIDKDKVNKENEIQLKKVEENIKAYNPDNEKVKVIKTSKTSELLKNIEVSLISIIYTNYYPFLFILLLITIGIYIKVFKLKKKKSNVKIDNEII